MVRSQYNDLHQLMPSWLEGAHILSYLNLLAHNRDLRRTGVTPHHISILHTGACNGACPPPERGGAGGVPLY